MAKTTQTRRGRLAEPLVDTWKLSGRAAYEKEQARLQQAFARVQMAYWQTGRRAVLVVEGWDAAGKGGAIRRLTALLDHRGVQVWPIAAPSEEERRHHWLWRFWARMPQTGRLAIFDRSWYGRVLVERVEALAKPAEWQRAFDEINSFERTLADDGVRIVKVFLHISPEEQAKRFRERLANPFKRWKLTQEDLRNRARWDDYVAAAEEMFARTDMAYAPWRVIATDSKWLARLEVLRIAVESLSDGVDLTPPPLDPELEAEFVRMLGGKQPNA